MPGFLSIENHWHLFLWNPSISNLLINEFIQSKLLPIDSVFSNLTTLDNVEMVNRLLNGQTVIADLTDGDYRLYKDNEFVAIATAKDKHIKMTKYFRI